MSISRDDLLMVVSRDGWLDTDGLTAVHRLLINPVSWAAASNNREPAPAMASCQDVPWFIRATTCALAWRLCSGCLDLFMQSLFQSLLQENTDLFFTATLCTSLPFPAVLV